MKNKGLRKFFGGGYTCRVVCFLLAWKVVMSDKRRYLREKIDVSANFYIVGGEYGKIEFSGVIANISEVGILIEVKEAKYIEVAQTAEIGSEIRFVGIDEYEIFNEQRLEYLEGTAIVVRFDEKDGIYLIGCEIKNLPRKLEKYIADRKVIGFKNRGCRL